MRAVATTTSEVATGGRYIYLAKWRGAAVAREVSTVLLVRLCSLRPGRLVRDVTADLVCFHPALTGHCVSSWSDLHTSHVCAKSRGRDMCAARRVVDLTCGVLQAQRRVNLCALLISATYDKMSVDQKFGKFRFLSPTRC